MVRNRFCLLAYWCSILVGPVLAQEAIGQSSDSRIKEMVSKINSEVDPAYVYDYQKTKFVPTDGKTLLIMGQTVERISEYQQQFPDQPIPGGWAAYWGVTEFNGVSKSHRNETGSTQNHQMLVDQFPNTVIQSAMWMVGTWDIASKAANGEYDEVIRKYASWAKKTKRPIFLRIGYEFDGPHNALEPATYVKAYQRIVDLLRKKGADNIAFVWHSYAASPYENHELSAWYPGDDYVDWVGISIFGHAYAADFGPHCEGVLNFAKEQHKPTMIAESNPIHGIDKHNSEVWEQWFVNYFNFIREKNIKATSFINENWSELNIPGISGWKDARLYNNSTISEAWFAETSKERYLKQSPELFDQLGFSSDE